MIKQSSWRNWRSKTCRNNNWKIQSGKPWENWPKSIINMEAHSTPFNSGPAVTIPVLPKRITSKLVRKLQCQPLKASARVIWLSSRSTLCLSMMANPLLRQRWLVCWTPLVEWCRETFWEQQRFLREWIRYSLGLVRRSADFWGLKNLHFTLCWCVLLPWQETNWNRLSYQAHQYCSYLNSTKRQQTSSKTSWTVDSRSSKAN